MASSILLLAFRRWGSDRGGLFLCRLCPCVFFVCLFRCRFCLARCLCGCSCCRSLSDSFSAQQDLFINRVGIIQWVGDRSYSIYLWHWPVVVLLAYFSKLAAPLWVLGGIVLSLLLAEFSYRLVEVPARKAVFWGKEWGAVFLTGFVLLVAVVCAQWIINSKGVLSRVPEDVIAIRAEKIIPTSVVTSVSRIIGLFLHLAFMVARMFVQ